MSVKVESFGFMPDGREAKLIFRLKYGQGFKRHRQGQVKNVLYHNIKNKLYYFFKIILICIIIQGCYHKSEKSSDNIVFRKIPCEINHEYNGKKSVELYYAISSKYDSADNFLIDKIDSFVCSQIKNGIIKKDKYDNLSIDFLKETELTLTMNNKGITDANNPGSTEHFSFASYQLFQENNIIIKSINNSPKSFLDTLKCLTNTPYVKNKNNN